MCEFLYDRVELLSRARVHSYTHTLKIFVECTQTSSFADKATISKFRSALFIGTSHEARNMLYMYTVTTSREDEGDTGIVVDASVDVPFDAVLERILL